MGSKKQHILFITSSRIGDAVLSTGLLDYLYKKYPEAQYTICCGPLAVSLFEGFPGQKNIIHLRKKTYNRHWIGLWTQIWAERFDVIVDLRDSAVSRLVRAGERHIFGKHIDKSLHKVEQNASVVGVGSDMTAPCLWFTEEQKKRADSLIPNGGPVLGVGPTANWAGKTWAFDRFIETVAWVTDTDGVLPNARVAVFAAPGEEENAYKVLESVPQDKRLDVIAKTDPGTAAATIARCDYYIGNDSGLMHCAAAAGVPTIGLFGPSYPHIYAPWGDHTTYVSTPETFDQLIDFEGYDVKTVGSLMESLTVEMVKDTILKHNS